MQCVLWSKKCLSVSFHILQLKEKKKQAKKEGKEKIEEEEDTDKVTTKGLHTEDEVQFIDKSCFFKLG